MWYRYPNIMAGSRDNTLLLSTNVHPLRGVRMSDDVVGDYQRVTLDVDAKDWLYLQVAGVDGVGDVSEGTELAISCFARVDGGPCKPKLSIRRGDSTHCMHDAGTTTWEDVGGGWTLCVTRAKRNATKFDYQHFHIGLPTFKAGTTIDVAQPAIFLGTTPRAWAPAEGESLPGGGCAHER